MTRLFAILAGALCLGACAGTGAPADSGAASTTNSAQTATEATTTAQAQTPADGGIEMADAPAVEPAETVQAQASAGDERICRRERRTGTHRAVRVCRTRAELERIEVESKDTFRELHDSQRQADRPSNVRQ